MSQQELIDDTVLNYNLAVEALQGSKDEAQEWYNKDIPRSIRLAIKAQDTMKTIIEVLHESLQHYLKVRINVVQIEEQMTGTEKMDFLRKLTISLQEGNELVYNAYNSLSNLKKKMEMNSAGNEPDPEKREEVNKLSIEEKLVAILEKMSTERTQNIIQRQPLKIPTFNGEPKNFQSYWTRFTALIDNESSFSEAEKMNMLYEGLEGKAKDLINIDPNAENYDYIKKMLKKEYGLNKTEVYDLIQDLQNIKPSSKKAEDCETKFREIRAILRRLETLGTLITKEMIMGNVMNKLPFKLVEDIIMNIDRMDVEDIMDKIFDNITKAKIRENSELKYKQLTCQPSFQPSFQPRERPTFTRNVQKFMCAFCNRSNHTSSKCRQYETVDQRRDRVKEKRLCWICFSDKHISKKCQLAKCKNCQLDHNVLLCKANQYEPKPSYNNGYKEMNWTPKPLPKKKEQQLINIEDNEPDENKRDWPSPVILGNLESDVEINRRMNIILKTAVAEVLNNKTGQFDKVNVIIDEGSMRSLITEQEAQNLGLPIKGNLVKTFYGIGGNEQTHPVNEVLMVIKTKEGLKEMMLNTKPCISVDINAPKLLSEDMEYIITKNISLANKRIKGEKFTPHLLIGLDCYKQIADLTDRERILPSGMVLKNTLLGGIIYGPMKTKANSKEISLFTVHKNEEKNLTPTEVADKLFSLDNMGIDFHEEEKAEITLKYYEEYAKGITIVDERITAPFPVKENINLLQENKKIALKRVHCLRTQLEKNELQRYWYLKIMNDYIDKGIVEKVPKNEINNNLKYYIPHHGVWREEKPKPLRIVFDASAKAKGAHSLNDVIATGSIFVNKIHDILLENRFHKIIIMCDIEAAFTQILLTQKDKDLCRFFWIEEDEEGKYRIEAYRFCRLPFGITTSPSILNMCLTKFLSQENSPLAEEILRLLYVDNISISAKTVKEAYENYKETKQMFAKVSMNIREFISNSQEFNNMIPEEDRLNQEKVKMLGVPYNVKTDMLSAIIDLKETKDLTKRIMLSQLHKSYDPIGMIAPLTLKMKLLLRDVFGQKAGWDEKLNNDVKQKWNEILEVINPVKINIKRLVPISKSTILWVFADASQLATAVCAYLQSESEVSNLLTGKVKLAPKRRLTIPKLELIAVRLAITLITNFLMKTAQNKLRLIKVVTDSHIVLDWICSTKKITNHVTHQITAIQTAMSNLKDMGYTVELYHVSTDKNPADIGTRGSTKTDLQNSMWIQGPQWLNSKHDSLIKFELPVVEEEIGKVNNEITLLNTSEIIQDDLTSEIINTRDHRKNMRKMIFVGKFIKNISCNKVLKTVLIKKFHDGIEVQSEEYEIAKKLLIRLAQANENLKEIQEKYKNWYIFHDNEGIIRISTRLQNAELPYDTKNPIWLPRHSELTKYIINQTHEKTGHQGRDYINMMIKQKYYLQKPIATIKHVIRECVICKRFQGLPYGAPRMPDLPRDRVVLVKPFQNVGCDLLGPLLLKNEEKVHVCLFTCMATRAIHLEVVSNTSAEAFLNAFQRFVSRRGTPRMIRSDNGSNFVLGNKILKDIVSHNIERNNQYKEFIHHYNLDKIKWIFNTPLAPWKGGAWERLIGIVKTVMNKVLGRYKTNYDELITIMTKIESIINTRPITFPDPSDPSSRPIRPIDFLNTHLRFSIPDYIEEEELDDPTYNPGQLQTARQATEAIQFIAQVTNQFWRRWQGEYLIAIKDINKVLRKQSRNKQLIPELGEIVLIKAENVPRGAWQLGKVMRKIYHNDGFIRSVELLTRGRRIERALDLVFPLELSSPLRESVDNSFEEAPDEPEVHRVLRSQTLSQTESQQELIPDETYENEPNNENRINEEPSNEVQERHNDYEETQELRINEALEEDDTPEVVAEINQKLINQVTNDMVDKWNMNEDIDESIPHVDKTTQKEVREDQYKNLLDDMEVSSISTFREDGEISDDEDDIPELFSTIEQPLTRKDQRKSQVLTPLEKLKKGKNDQTRWERSLPEIIAETRRRFEERERLIKEQMREERKTQRKPPNLLNIVTTTMLLMALIAPSMASPEMFCKNNWLYIKSIDKPAVLCIDDDCLNVKNERNKTWEYELKPIPGKTIANIKLITEDNTEVMKCIRAQFCSKATLMSRTLIGNPTCWPEGAQISLFLIITIILVILLPILKYFIHKFIALHCVDKAKSGYKQSKRIVKNMKSMGKEDDESNDIQLFSITQTDDYERARQYKRNSREILENHLGRRLPAIIQEDTEEIEETVNPYANLKKPVLPKHNTQTEPEKTEVVALYDDVPLPQAARKSKLKRWLSIPNLTLIVFMLHNAKACQDYHMRYIADLKCDNRTYCYYQFGREFMFNTLTSKLCVLLRHNNVTVGSMEVEKLNSTLTCVPQHEFYTRMTKPFITAKKLCKGEGSCKRFKCENTAHNSTINEFSHLMGHAGQSGCALTCGGLQCGCALFSAKACTFYRMIHKPINEEIFEIFKCLEFVNSASFRITVIFRKNISTFEFQMTPYKKVSTKYFNATIISQVNQYIPALQNRFAKSKNRTIMLYKGNDQFMIKCDSKFEAEHKVCYTPKICNCVVQEAIVNCDCPENPIMVNEKTHRLPIITSSFEIRNDNKSVMVKQKNDEILFLLESNMLMDSASKNLNYPCSPSFVNISGCYDCPQGASITLGCMSTVDTWVTIQCDNHIRSIECAPYNPHTKIIMFYDQAMIQQTCHTTCANMKRNLIIEGTLSYYSPEEEYLFVNQKVQQNTRFIPDLQPLKEVLLDRWKSTAAMTAASSVTSLISYAYGAQVLTIASKPIIWISIKASVMGWKILYSFLKAVVK